MKLIPIALISIASGILYFFIAFSKDNENEKQLTNEKDKNEKEKEYEEDGDEEIEQLINHKKEVIYVPRADNAYQRISMLIKG